jgi:hypothetical protein
MQTNDKGVIAASNTARAIMGRQTVLGGIFRRRFADQINITCVRSSVVS